MGERVCPWWLGYFLASPLRRWWQDPAEILAPYIKPGMTVLEPGPGMGFFTLELARLVGESGRIICVDVQPKMIAELKRRVAKAGLLGRVDARVVPGSSMQLDNLAVDFTLAFAVVHEFPSAAYFFTEVAAASKPGAGFLLVEPSGHVKPADFDGELQAASKAGFSVQSRPVIGHNHAALLSKIPSS